MAFQEAFETGRKSQANIANVSTVQQWHAHALAWFILQGNEITQNTFWLSSFILPKGMRKSLT